jgi:hypothetical protein
MICNRRFVLAAGLLPVLTAAAFAGDADKRSLYPCVNILSFFTPEMRAELKITPDQQRSLEGADGRRQAIWRGYCEEDRKVIDAKLPEREKDAKRRALETQVVNDLCKLYGETLWPAQIKRMKQIALQIRGIEIFDYPEIRSALKIGDKEAKELHAAWDKWAYEKRLQLQDDVAAKKITNQEAARLAGSAARSVPRKVRELLSQEQQKILEDFLGEKYIYKN